MYFFFGIHTKIVVKVFDLFFLVGRGMNFFLCLLVCGMVSYDVRLKGGWSVQRDMG